MSAINPGAPRAPPSNIAHGASSEEAPLLGRPGDVTMSEEQSLSYNLLLGTAPLAQVGGLVLVVLVWASAIMHNLIVFDGHPMLNSLAVLLAVQAILILQPTGMYDMAKKRSAAYLHATFVAFAAVCFLAALAIVVWHKQNSHIPHFETLHSKFGIATYALIIIQALIGFTQLFIPQIYGGEDNAKAMFKYHRIAGYVIILPMIAVTFILATRTYYGGHVLNIKTWAVVLASVAIIAGIYPRIKLSKLGWY